MVRAKYSAFVDNIIFKKNQAAIDEKLKSISDGLQEARTRSSTNKQSQLVQLQATSLLQATLRKKTILVKKFKKKIICALRSDEANENLDMWLTIAEKNVNYILTDRTKLHAVFAKQTKNKRLG
jgi:hypothetical protein